MGKHEAAGYPQNAGVLVDTFTINVQFLYQIKQNNLMIIYKLFMLLTTNHTKNLLWSSDFPLPKIFAIVKSWLLSLFDMIWYIEGNLLKKIPTTNTPWLYYDSVMGVFVSSKSAHPYNKVHGAHLGPVGPRWAPCWPHQPCYQGNVLPTICWCRAER